MTSSIIAGSVLIAIAVLILIWGIITSNNLIAKKNRVEQCRSGICVVLKQRNDLIPNLVASLKAYMGHENENPYPHSRTKVIKQSLFIWKTPSLNVSLLYMPMTR